MQIHGAFNYMTGSETERDLRDLIAEMIFSGTSEIQCMIIARLDFEIFLADSFIQ